MIKENVLIAGTIALRVAMIGILGLLVLIVVQLVLPGIFHMEHLEIVRMPDNVIKEGGIMYILLAYWAHILIFAIVLVSSFVGYKLVVASGASTDVVIPPQDYPLLGPLVAAGNTEAVDLYVRLSSLSGFTGTFTQLGLTGLPLATIFMTLFFTLLTIYKPDTFLDLTKLTLGAFLGSFVQRQVEQRRMAPEAARSARVGISRDQSTVPPSSA